MSILHRLFVAKAASHAPPCIGAGKVGIDNLKAEDCIHTSLVHCSTTRGGNSSEDILEFGREKLGKGNELGDGEEKCAGPAHLSWHDIVLSVNPWQMRPPSHHSGIDPVMFDHLSIS